MLRKINYRVRNGEITAGRIPSLTSVRPNTVPASVRLSPKNTMRSKSTVPKARSSPDGLVPHRLARAPVLRKP